MTKSSLILKLYPYISTILGISLVIGFVFLYSDLFQKKHSPIEYVNANQSSEIDNQEKLITAHIEGQIQKSGTYQLQPGSIIQDLIEKAGGLTDLADINNDNINLATLVNDNDNIVIPTANEKQPATQTSSVNPNTNANSSLININTASSADLISLPSIGPATAQKIIDYRTTKRFTNIEELMEVKGIGEKTFEKLKNQITV